MTSFYVDEELYYRIKRESLEQDGSIKPAMVHFPSQSVNCSQLGYPTDVLLPNERADSHQNLVLGVAIVLARELPTPYTTGSGAQETRYEFCIEHDPVELNYGHCEIRVFKGGKEERSSSKIGNTVKKHYRTIVGLKSRVAVRPIDTVN